MAEMNDNDPKIIGAHADHVSPLPVREQSRKLRDMPWQDRSPPVFKRGLLRNVLGAIASRCA